MKSKKILLIPLCVICLCKNTAVLAAPIDNVEIYNPAGQSDQIIFTAGEHQGSQSGTGNSNIESENENSISSQNATISNEQQSIIDSLVTTYGENKMLIYQPGTSVVIREDVPVSVQQIMPFIMNGLKYNNVPGFVSVSHNIPSVELSENTQSTIENLKQDVGSGITSGGSLPMGLGDGAIDWNWIQGVDISDWTQDLQNAWKEIQSNHTMTQIRTDLVEGGIIEWPYLELRYEILKAYVQSLGMNDMINTTHIEEYRVAKEEKQKIISKQPISEYKWEICDEDGNVLKTTHTYGRTLKLAFSKAGTYYLRAYQKHYVTRADVISTQKIEYWMISETKQLLWKSEIAGKEYTYDRNVAEEYLQTNYIQQKITESMIQDNWLFSLNPSGQLIIDEGFQVERIK